MASRLKDNGMLIYLIKPCQKTNQKYKPDGKLIDIEASNGEKMQEDSDGIN